MKMSLLFVTLLIVFLPILPHCKENSFFSNSQTYMCGVCVLIGLCNSAHSQPCRPASGGKKKKKHVESKGPFPNPHKLHVT